jgi:hypothetical protein
MTEPELETGPYSLAVAKSLEELKEIMEECQIVGITPMHLADILGRDGGALADWQKKWAGQMPTNEEFARSGE